MERKGVFITRIFLILLSIIFIFIGVMREEYLVVLQKAVNICFECIGIG